MVLKRMWNCTLLSVIIACANKKNGNNKTNKSLDLNFYAFIKELNLQTTIKIS